MNSRLTETVRRQTNYRQVQVSLVARACKGVFTTGYDVTLDLPTKAEPQQLSQINFTTVNVGSPLDGALEPCATRESEDSNLCSNTIFDMKGSVFFFRNSFPMPDSDLSCPHWQLLFQAWVPDSFGYPVHPLLLI